MSRFRLASVALLAGTLLSACANPAMMNAGWVNPWVTPYPPANVNPTPAPPPVTYVDVYKYQGSRQCENSGVPLVVMQNQLQMANIPVTNSSCGMDGRMYPAFCGGADGKINVFTIPSNAVYSALSQGFLLLKDLPGAQRTGCNTAPAANNPPPASNTTTYPYTGNYNPSYYSYR